MMKFNSEEDAFEYWQEAYYLSGGGYESTGRSYDDRVDMFNDWVDDQGVEWLDDELREIIDTWEL